jgi:hypothetical protein
VVFGQDVSDGIVIDLASLSHDQGFVIDSGAGSGIDIYHAMTIGDINGDNAADILVGYEYDDAEYAGVIFGGGSVSGTVIDISDLSAENGFDISYTGRIDFAAPLGNIDNDADGTDDFAIIVVDDESYILFGSEDIGTQPIDLSSPLPPDEGFAVENGDLDIYSIVSAGDINGDEIDDFIIGASYYDAVYYDTVDLAFVMFGGDHISSGIDLTSFDPSQGFLIESEIGFESVSSAGDINGDNYDDILLHTEAGTGYVLFGGENTENIDIDECSFESGEGFMIVPSELYVESMVSAGDVNNDGYDDLLLAFDDGEPASSYNWFPEGPWNVETETPVILFGGEHIGEFGIHDITALLPFVELPS